jgi:predicted dehydrogenase
MSKPIDAILIGAGQRGGDAYGAYALKHPEQIRFVAVAEPNSLRREIFANRHGIPHERTFESWEPLLALPKMARAALVCTQDQYHTAPTLAALESGYDVLLEKPMATTPEECRLLVKKAKQLDRQLNVCHVLRYTTHFQTMRQIIQSGVLGQIVNIAHRENVSWWHMAHSYVRGNWANRELSSPMILAKCCHDFDILLWLMGRKCTSLSSVGSLIHFRPENAPEGAPDFCLDGCPVAETCPYYAPHVYVDLIPLWRSISDSSVGLVRWVTGIQQRKPALIKMASYLSPILRQVSDYRGWPRSVVALDPTPDSLLEALRSGPYGRCVYRCENDVVDHQATLMEFEDGLSVTLTMHGHSHLESRTTRIEGSRGTLQGFFGTGGAWIEVNEHRSDRRTRYNTGPKNASGHGGGDEKLMAAFVSSLRQNGKGALTTAGQALESHLMAFSAETARLEKRIIDRAEFSSGYA